MKRFIFSIVACALVVLGTASFAHAQSFNNDPRDMATVLVGKTACTAGPVNGCWQPSVTASPGDIVAVHLYYHNTGTTVAPNVAVGINPRTTGVASSHTMRGGILVNGTIAKLGSATINLTAPAALTFIDATWFPNQSTTGQPANATALFDNYGMSVGNLSPGWGAQGTVVARYRVGENVQPTTYQCNDGIDNDGDGRVDYPNDAGCYSATDNYEGDDQQVQCLVNQYYASPTTVASGNFTMLYWNTTGCDYLTIDGVNYPVNSSGSFGPLYSGRNYELRAWKNNGALQTRTVYVGVNQINNTVYQCNDGIDNDGDGRVDYPNDAGCSSAYDNDEYNSVVVQTQPQAITTVATINSTTSARLNGIAVPNYTGVSQAWFEWGTSGSLGYRTNTQSVTNTGSTYISDTLSGLVPGTMYYYRTVVQNANGTAYGDIVRFQTQQGTVTPPRVITKVVTQTKDVVVAKSAPSLLELRVENVYDRMCVGGEMEYTVYYRNISGQTLKDTVLRVVHPKELTFVNASRGSYAVVDRALTLSLGELTAGESGSVVVRVRVNNEAVRGNVAVLTAQVVYTNTVTKAQEDAIAYSLITVSDDCPNILGASAFGIGSFFPTTLLGWLVLILIILALIVLGRQLYKNKA